MLFSEHFRITPTDDDDWFDTLLPLDTPLFLDPFLIYADEFGHFMGSHDEVIGFFDSIFKLIAASHGEANSVRYQKAIDDLVFPEVKELCLGYTSEGTDGSGTGLELADLIASGLSEAINAGLQDISHFEEIAILGENIGRDRIGDITAGLLRWRLAAYTLEICQRHGIPTEPIRHPRGRYDPVQRRWMPLKILLPKNPCKGGKGILLAPRRYLRNLPTINHDDFWDYCYAHANDALRAQLNFDITSRVGKAHIMQVARSRPDLLQKYLEDVETRDGEPYDFGRDETGLRAWYKPTQEYCRRCPITLEPQKLRDFVDEMIKRFVDFVELGDGWRLLWNGSVHKNEPAARYILYGIVTNYCLANGVTVEPVSNIGDGVVKLTTSGGTSFRLLLELKLITNGRFWNALKRGAPDYEKAEDTDCNRLIAVLFDRMHEDRFKEIARFTGDMKPEYDLKLLHVDASSDDASRLRSVQQVNVIQVGDGGQIRFGDGDTFQVEGDAKGSSFGRGASVEARDIVDNSGDYDGRQDRSAG